MTQQKPLRWLVLAALLIAFFTAVRPAPLQAQSPGAEIVRLVNEFRAQLGLPGFTYNATLSVAAQQQANYLAETNIYTHSGYGGSTPQSRATAVGYPGRVTENIVGGTNLSPRQGLIWWQNSPVHYNTITSQRYTEIGVGFAQANGQNFYAIVVGNPTGDLRLPNNRGDTADAGNDAPAALRVVPITLAEPDENGAIIHTVQDGQSLWMIAAHYDVPLSDLYYFNSLSEDDFLQAGDTVTIKLGEGQEPPPTPAPPSTHTVRSGETLWTIAARYNISLSDLLWYNGLSADALISPGDELKIRLQEGEAPPPTPTPVLTHIVRAGDSLWGIAASYGLDIEQLLAWNALTPDSLLLAGDELWIQQPPATPTAVPTATTIPTLPPTAVSQTTELAASLPTATPSSLATATATLVPTATPAPEQNGAILPDWFASVGSIFLGLGLIGLAGGAFVFLSRR